ncbi:hypothetical protein ACP8H3_18360 [Bacillus velezensis]
MSRTGRSACISTEAFDGSIALKVMPEPIIAGAEGLKALYETGKSAQ